MTVLGCEWANVWPQLNSNNYLHNGKRKRLDIGIG